LASAHASYRSLDQMLLPIVAVLAGFSFLLSTVVVTSFVVLLSHRIAGPLYRFRLVLEGLAQRRIPVDAKIRPDDQLGELSDTMGQALTTLRTDLGALRIAVAALEKARLDQDPQGIETSIADMKTLLAAWETPVRD
ncbi:MAG: hypothetical protein Q8O00_02530, partial [Holophaga sp.]|nr:hypothetical protein [Holophaga sp.]